jgi:rhodanese-related sulfurtransferase
MTNKKTIRWMGGLAALACTFLFRPPFLWAQGTGEAYPLLSSSEGREMIAKHSGDRGFVLLDVRSPKEFVEERIAGAVMVDYLSPSFGDEIAKLDRGKSYLVYCRTGHRTEAAAKVMRDLGFKNVSVLAGGITKWKAAGFPTVR